VDNATSFLFINDHMKRAKTGLTSAFNNYLHATPEGHPCWYLLSNQGGEYMGCTFQDLLPKRRIMHVPIVLHMPKLNKVAKCFNRTVLTMVQAFITESGVKEELWGKALYTAIYVSNCTCNAATTPSSFKCWFGKPASLSSMSVWLPCLHS